MKPETVRKADDAGRARGCGSLHAQGVIFDMDGVIFDTERFYLDCCIPAAEKLGMERIEEVSFRCIGLTKEETDRRMLEFYGPDAPLDDFEREVSAVFRQRYEELKHMPVKPGAEALLSWLKQRQVPLALASSTRIAIVTQELKDAGLYGYFDVIIGGDMVSRSKPEPDIFLKAAELLGEKPDNCIVIEDSFNGIRAAKAAGMTAVMVPDQLEPDEEMRNLADIILPSLTDVKKWLEQKRTDEKEISKTQAM